MTQVLRLAPVLGLLSLAACGASLDAPASSGINDGTFGNATMTNVLVQSGQRDATFALATRFAAEVPTTITFDFNSATLTPQAQATLARQADWIRQFPELRFSVYGHTDAVGSDAYNRALGKRRAQAVVAFFASQGISAKRLQALVSYGETRPVIATQEPEEQNRRTVTEVSGFVTANPRLLNGKYAQIVMREYIRSATPSSGTTTTTGTTGTATTGSTTGTTGGTATGGTSQASGSTSP